MPFEFDTVNEKWIVYKTFQEINDLTEINLSFWTFEIVLCVKWQGWASIWKESFTAELTRDFFQQVHRERDRRTSGWTEYSPILLGVCSTEHTRHMLNCCPWPNERKYLIFHPAPCLLFFPWIGLWNTHHGSNKLPVDSLDWATLEPLKRLL